MKLVMLVAVAAIVAGGVYHEDVARFFSKAAKGSYSTTSSSSVTNSVKGTGSSTNSLMGGVSNAITR